MPPQRITQRRRGAAHAGRSEAVAFPSVRSLKGAPAPRPPRSQGTHTAEDKCFELGPKWPIRLNGLL